MNDQVFEELLAVAAAVLPGENTDGATLTRGGSHEVVLLPGRAVVRVARNPAAAAALPRRTELLRRLAGLGLPFPVPVPLSDVTEVAGRTAVALSWVGGEPCPKGEGGHPRELAALLAALRGVDCDRLSDLLGAPHEYAGGDRVPPHGRSHPVPLPEAARRLLSVRTTVLP
ncbi:phosphotransferase [Kitasatospora sp. NPDC056138]|uniref:phosphotransferase n=1 Tax=Kitasatospora sp. NPDC056138 TaxID=3345724 RepID=UPI0035D984E0